MDLDPASFKGLSRFLAPSAGGPLADRALDKRPDAVSSLYYLKNVAEDIYKNTTRRDVKKWNVDHIDVLIQTTIGRRRPSSSTTCGSTSAAPGPCFITVGISNDRTLGISSSQNRPGWWLMALPGIRDSPGGRITKVPGHCSEW